MLLESSSVDGPYSAFVAIDTQLVRASPEDRTSPLVKLVHGFVFLSLEAYIKQP